MTAREARAHARKTMCQACLLLARRRAADAASADAAPAEATPVEAVFGPRRPARFSAVAEWAEAPDEAADGTEGEAEPTARAPAR